MYIMDLPLDQHFGHVDGGLIDENEIFSPGV